MKKEIHISIMGEIGLPKLELIKYYMDSKNIREEKHKDGRLYFLKNKTKIKIYEFSKILDKKEKRSKDIANNNNQCIIIVFDMNDRNSFIDVLDKWIKYLRELKYKNKIILFGSYTEENKDELPMTDEREIKDLFEVTQINGEFIDIRNKTKEDIINIIETCIEKIFSEFSNNKNKKGHIF